jgi:hypothetical protein
LDAQRPGLISLAAQSETALNAGKQMSEASTATLQSFQAVLKQLGASPSSPDSEPFRINDYTAAAAQMKATAEDLVKLLQTLDQTMAPEHFDKLSANIAALSRQAQANGKELVDYAFNKTLLLGLLLIGSAGLIGLASALAYWKLRKKFA